MEPLTLLDFQAWRVNAQCLLVSGRQQRAMGHSVPEELGDPVHQADFFQNNLWAMDLQLLVVKMRPAVRSPALLVVPEDKDSVRPRSPMGRKALQE